MKTFRLLHRLTLTQQWLIATLLATIPLALAVVYAVWSLTEQTQDHRHLLLSTSAIKDLEASIAQQVGGLERANLQFILIDDDRIRDLYQDRLDNLRDNQQRLQGLLKNGEELQTLNRLIDQVSVSTVFGERSDGSTKSIKEVNEKTRQHWQAINDLRLEFNQQITRLTQASIDESESHYQAVLGRLILLLTLTIPGTGLLIILSTVAVARPWWRMAATIRRLGEHQWQQPVQIEGPADFVELGKDLEWMREQLVAIDRQKQSFSQHVTHELKSPLAAIIEAESLLRDQLPGPINQRQKAVLDILQKNAFNLNDLIQQFLNYNTVVHNLVPDLTRVNVHELFQKMSHQLADSFPERPISWQWRADSNNVLTDSFCLNMILSNLLSNAHNAVSDKGTIRVSFETGTSHWTLSVEDDGPGINQEENQNIFKPFYQGRTQRRGPLKGSGIGLSIVQECVERLKGNIIVDQSPLGGARFFLTFPSQTQTESQNVEALSLAR